MQTHENLNMCVVKNLKTIGKKKGHFDSDTALTARISNTWALQVGHFFFFEIEIEIDNDNNKGVNCMVYEKSN